MPHAPAGWYDYPGAPGTTRYWTGAAWLAPGVGPAVAAPGFAPQPTGFAPQPTGFAPQPTGFAPQPTGLASQPEFRPAPAVTDSQEQVRTVASQYLQPRATDPLPAAQEEAVTWDVVGIPRTSDDAGVGRAPHTPWQGSAPQGYGRAGDPSAYAPSLYGSQPPLPSYGSSTYGRQRRSGWTKVGAVVTIAVIGFGVRWGIGQFFGGDYSDDGRIEVATPDSWTVTSVKNPDISYAIDGGWSKVPASDLAGVFDADSRLIDARAVATDFSGNRAYILITTSVAPTAASRLSRQDLERSLDAILDGIESRVGGSHDRDKMKVLTSRAGDRWGIKSEDFLLEGITVEVYFAMALLDDYPVGIQLIVPEGVELTENDLLAVANSVDAK